MKPAMSVLGIDIATDLPARGEKVFYNLLFLDFLSSRQLFPSGYFQIPPDLVVKTQAIDIVEVIV
jgi:hypothetical protein